MRKSFVEPQNSIAMNRLSQDKQVQILNMMVEGCSLRSISRLTGCSINTVSKLLVDTGRKCMDYHFENVRNVRSKRIQADEIWSFVYAKSKHVDDDMRERVDCPGSAWTWVGFDPDSKLVVSWIVGDRGDDCAEFFMNDLQSRLANRVQLTTDGHRGYLDAVDLYFGNNVDYAQVVKIYKANRYEGCEKRIHTGNPEYPNISTL